MEGFGRNSQWSDEGGHNSSPIGRGSAFSDLGIPEKAVIEVVLSWTKKPDFDFALEADVSDRRRRVGFQFEVWDDELVIVGESARDADAVSVQRLGSNDRPGSLQYVPGSEGTSLGLVVAQRSDRWRRWTSKGNRDRQPRGELLKAGSTRTPVKPPGVPTPTRPDAPAKTSGVRLTNSKGDVRLEHLRITRWNGVSPRDVRDDQSRLHRMDGSIVYGHLAAFRSEIEKVHDPRRHDGNPGRARCALPTCFCRRRDSSGRAPKDSSARQPHANAARGVSRRLAFQRHGHAHRGSAFDAHLPGRQGTVAACRWRRCGR